MNSVLVEMWHLFQQQSACVIIDAFRKTKLLPLDPSDHDTNTQACLAETQTPSGKKSKEIEEIASASMAPVAVDAIKARDPMVIRQDKEHLVDTNNQNQITRGAQK